MADHSITRHLTNPTGDADPVETQEWRDAFMAVLANEGTARVSFLLDQIAMLGLVTFVLYPAWLARIVRHVQNTTAVPAPPLFRLLRYPSIYG